MNKKRPLRPRDAASLILYRRGAAGIEVLMGQRNAGHAFMPNRFVFPGGRVDPGDHRVPVATSLEGVTAERLSRSCRGAARAHAHAITAVRETYEETGLMIGRPSPNAERLDARHWAGFRAAGLAPALDRLTYMFRAVTPPHYPRRFDARFFLVEMDETVAGLLTGNGELEHLTWLPVDEALALPLSTPTHLVLVEARRWIEAEHTTATALPVPYLFTRQRHHVFTTE